MVYFLPYPGGYIPRYLPYPRVYIPRYLPYPRVYHGFILLTHGEAITPVTHPGRL